jgi:hypothetical protein
MKIRWTLTHKTPPNAQPVPDFTAFYGQEAIGRVYQIDNGPDRGLWIWAMVVDRPGTPFAHQSNGRTTERGKAGRCVIEAYSKLLG